MRNVAQGDYDKMCEYSRQGKKGPDLERGGGRSALFREGHFFSLRV